MKRPSRRLEGCRVERTLAESASGSGITNSMRLAVESAGDSRPGSTEGRASKRSYPDVRLLESRIRDPMTASGRYSPVKTGATYESTSSVLSPKNLEVDVVAVRLLGLLQSIYLQHHWNIECRPGDDAAPLSETGNESARNGI